MHSALAAHDTDPHFAPEEPSAESLALLAAAIDEEIAVDVRVASGSTTRSAPSRTAAEDLRDLVQELAAVGPSGLAIRAHGDYHLGQVLWSTERRLGRDRLRGRACALARRAATQALAAARRSPG